MSVDFPRIDLDNKTMTQTQQLSYQRFTRSTSATIRTVSALELVARLPELIELFTETVNGGTPLGFMAPINHGIAREYWISIIRELETRERLLFIAYDDNAVVGSGQLLLSQRSNSPHRAELQKVFVERASRGRGIGRALMNAIHTTALEHARTLILCNTRHDEPAERFYKSLGYKEAGVIPGWTVDREGERYAHATLYKELGRDPAA
jgi:acetyltransferase